MQTFLTGLVGPPPFHESGPTKDPAKLDRARKRFGRALTLSRTSGLETLSDLNGNTVTVTADGILHSSGKSVTFERDTEHRITRITDPSGHTLKYAYDAAGDLVSFTDKVGNISTYSSTASAFGASGIGPDRPLSRPLERSSWKRSNENRPSGGIS